MLRALAQNLPVHGELIKMLFMLSRTTLVSEIQKRFPSIIIDDEFQDVLLVVSNTLTEFIVREEVSNSPTIGSVVEFINELVDCKGDDDISYFLTETILNLYYDRGKFRYEDFKNKLSRNSQDRFEFTVSSWLKGNKL